MPNLTKHEIIDIHYDDRYKHLSYAYSFYSGKYIIGRYVDFDGDIYCFIKIPSTNFNLKTCEYWHDNYKEVYLGILKSAVSYFSDEMPPDGEAEIKACISLIDDFDNFINGDVVRKLEGYTSKMDEKIRLIKSKYEPRIYDEIKKVRSKNAKFK